MTEIISIVGKSNSGKTTLIEKLIPEIKTRGFRIGIIKNTAHGFNIDKNGKDSWRHREAGADTVVVTSKNSIAIIKKVEEVSLDSLKTYFDDLDIVITEGFKHGNKPKIEIFRKEIHKEPMCVGKSDLVAFVTDSDIDPGVPCFSMDDISQIADFIIDRFVV